MAQLVEITQNVRETFNGFDATLIEQYIDKTMNIGYVGTLCVLAVLVVASIKILCKGTQRKEHYQKDKSQKG